MIGREAAIEAKASAFSLEFLGMCSSFHAGKLLKRCFTRETYFAIRGSQDSNYLLTCPTTNWESLLTRSLPADKAAASSSPARMASYSDSLLEALNPSRMARSIISLDGDFNCKPTPAPVCLEAPSIFSVHQSKLSGWVSDWGSSAMKSTSTCPFFESLGLYWMSYSLSSIAQHTILPNKSGLCMVLQRGRSVNTTMGCAWK